MAILTPIKNSIYSPEYYKDLLERPFSDSVKYFFKFTLVLALVMAVIVTVVGGPRLHSFLERLADKVVVEYPSELKVEIKNGQVSTNVEEPYVIKMPNELKNNSANVTINGSQPKDFKNALVIDTHIDKSNFSIAQFTSFDSAFLLTKDSVIGYGKDGNITIQLIPNGMSWSVDKPTVQFYANKVKSFFSFTYPIVFIGVFLVTFFTMMGMFIYLIFGACVIWVVGKITKMNIGYKDSYKMGLHIITLGILLYGLVIIIGFFVPDFHTFPFLFTIILVAISFINFGMARKETHLASMNQSSN